MMNRFYLPQAFSLPDDYKLPPLHTLNNDTQHPELNSNNYRYTVSKYQPPNDFLPYYSHLTQNEDGLFILASNEYTTCVLSGVLGGTYDFEDIVNSKFSNTKFNAVFKSTILGIYNLDQTTFAVALGNGKIELYSTKAQKTLLDKDHRNKFCFIKIASQATDGQCNSLAIFNNDNRFIVGTSRGHFECYSYYSHNITKIFTTEYGMSMEITGISPHPEIDANWVSTSSDKSCMMWDKRFLYPAKYLIQKHNERLTDVHWMDLNTVILSDSAGNIMVYDTRNPKESVSKKSVINRVIQSIKFNGTKFGIVSESSKAMVYEVNAKKEVEFLHQHDVHPRMINDFCWEKYDQDNCYYVVGNRKYAKKLTLPTQK